MASINIEEKIQIRQLKDYGYTALGIAVAASLIILGFDELFSKGRIWAEEGTLFMNHWLQSNQHEGLIIRPYIHNGHWDLWTNIAAAFASRVPKNSPLVFTWMGFFPHLLTAFCMSRFTIREANASNNKKLISTIGFFALFCTIFAGGPEVTITTTNTQWILCSYIFFATYINFDQKDPGNNSGLLHIILDIIIAMSSFAGSILFTTQIIIISILENKGRSYKSTLRQLIQNAKLSIGFTIGTAVQVITTFLYRTESSNGRNLEPINALKGFFVQGVAGLIIPSNGPLEAFAEGVRENFGAINLFPLIILLIFCR